MELKDIELPPTMQRAMARQAEAEREKRAKIIAAEGEALSADRLAEAADVISAHPVALQLRNLQILSEIAAEKNSTIVFPAQFLESARALARFIEEESRRATAPLPRLDPRTAPAGSGRPTATGAREPTQPATAHRPGHAPFS
ncbi:hypothetical protein [Streptomyces noursei]|uniref:hypothetical protein n=1 Tax=Streptomyces noursei TaxID=1971 RepID=UPI001964DFFD|nr:hypothetical protein [Streptomyces noursei]QRX90243.1 hypothetical protein JNO44_04655 [Streptomyces noursei]